MRQPALVRRNATENAPAASFVPAVPQRAARYRRYRRGMPRALVVAVVVACGGSPPNGTWKGVDVPRKTVDTWTSADEDRFVELACTNLVGPKGNLRCDFLVKAGLTATTCKATMASMPERSGAEHERTAYRALLVGLATSTSCHNVVASYQVALLISRTPQKNGERCSSRGSGPFSLTADEAKTRRGFDARLLSDVTSSLDSPVQVCGTAGELQWLTRITCKDGSRPWGGDSEKAHAARAGSTISNKASRCPNDSLVIDRYVVPCPERAYDVYMDMYECGPNETF